MKKLITVLLCGAVLLAAAACQGKPVEPPNRDPNRTKVINVANYDGGSGHDWIDALEKEYEELHKDVDVVTVNKKDEFTGLNLVSNMPYDSYDIYFVDHANYVNLRTAGVLEDITDTVTQKSFNQAGDLPEAGETAVKSIEDTMLKEFRDFYNVGTEDRPQYYAIPYFAGISGIIYDADLFESKRYYFDKSGQIGVGSNDPDIGPGPDGDFATAYDNGMPETWTMFRALMNQIISDSIVPFTWSGQYAYTRQYALEAVYTNYEGKNNALLNYTQSGTDSVLGTITSANAYELRNQNGRLAGLTVAKELSQGKYYTENSFLGIQSHTAAQEEYIYSVNTNERIAMLAESSYWETEARGAFNDMEEIKSEWGYGKRNFKMMAPPRFTDTPGVPAQVNDRTTLYGDATGKMVMINKNSRNKEDTKEFLKFVQSRKSMATFTIHSGSVRPYEYDMTQAEIAEATPFMRHVLEIYNSDRVDTVFQEDFSALRQNNSDYFIYDWFKADFGNQRISWEPIDYFKNNASTTVQAYLNGMRNCYSAANWPRE